jgi:hypothetical protein
VCDCACGGVNHGTGRLVQTIVKEGKVKAIDFSEEDMLRAYKYRELRDFAIKQRDAITHAYDAIVARRQLDKIIGMRVYEPRQKALIDFIVKHKR